MSKKAKIYLAIIFIIIILPIIILLINLIVSINDPIYNNNNQLSDFIGEPYDRARFISAFINGLRIIVSSLFILFGVFKAVKYRKDMFKRRGGIEIIIFGILIFLFALFISPYINNFFEYLYHKYHPFYL